MSFLWLSSSARILLPHLILEGQLASSFENISAPFAISLILPSKDSILLVEFSWIPLRRKIVIDVSMVSFSALDVGVVSSFASDWCVFNNSGTRSGSSTPNVSISDNVKLGNFIFSWSLFFVNLIFLLL